MTMESQVSHKRGRVRLTGEFNIYNAAAVTPKLLSTLSKHKAAPLDLSGVTEFDTAGLQMLLAARRFCGAQGRSLSLVEPSPVVQDVLQLCRISFALETAS